MVVNYYKLWVRLANLFNIYHALREVRYSLILMRIRLKRIEYKICSLKSCRHFQFGQIKKHVAPQHLTCLAFIFRKLERFFSTPRTLSVVIQLVGHSKKIISINCIMILDVSSRILDILKNLSKCL